MQLARRFRIVSARAHFLNLPLRVLSSFCQDAHRARARAPPPLRATPHLWGAAREQNHHIA
eukprot:8132871-Pyramimonas_sp.AAC.1